MRATPRKTVVINGEYHTVWVEEDEKGQPTRMIDGVPSDEWIDKHASAEDKAILAFKGLQEPHE